MVADPGRPGPRPTDRETRGAVAAFRGKPGQPRGFCVTRLPEDLESGHVHGERKVNEGGKIRADSSFFPIISAPTERILVPPSAHLASAEPARGVSVSTMSTRRELLLDLSVCLYFGLTDAR
jgi:hypothetical protein